MINLQSEKVKIMCIKKGDYVYIKNYPCKVLQTKMFKRGKLGDYKYYLSGIDIITNKMYEQVMNYECGEIFVSKIIDKRLEEIIKVEKWKHSFLDSLNILAWDNACFIFRKGIKQNLIY